MFQSYFLPGGGRSRALPNKGVGQGIKLRGACTRSTVVFPVELANVEEDYNEKIKSSE